MKATTMMILLTEMYLEAEEDYVNASSYEEAMKFDRKCEWIERKAASYGLDKIDLHYGWSLDKLLAA